MTLAENECNEIWSASGIDPENEASQGEAIRDIYGYISCGGLKDKFPK